jgi:hypothetical protein
MNIDYSKYKRLFTFGCSFTGYKYPTWANIMNKHVPQAEFYNLGRSGGGNVFIANRITEANRKFNFCDTDLVMVMWSTFCREDRYLPNRGWMTPGNIYTQDELDFATTEYLVKWADPLTFLVRDLSIIELTSTYLKSLPCDDICMLSVPFDHQMDHANAVAQNMLDAYSGLEDSYPLSMFELEMNGHWDHSSHYVESWSNGEKHGDYHPSPARYAEYLRKIGINLSDGARNYALESTSTLSSITHWTEFDQLFPNLDPRTLPTEKLI